MQKTLILCISLSIPGLVSAACDQAVEKQVRESPMENRGKVNMLKTLGCPTDDIEKQLADELATAISAARERAEADRAKEAAEKQADMQASLDRMNQEAEETRAEQEAYAKVMRAKCGKFPIRLQIGSSERLLRAGCFGEVYQVGASQTTHTYTLAGGVLVYTTGGKVTEWVGSAIP